MSAEESIGALRQIDFKEINSLCSKHNLNMRIDEYTQRKFDMSLKTVHLLITQPIEIAVQRQTKMDTMQPLRDIKKVLDVLYLKTKEQKYKNHLDGLNEIMTNSKLK